MDTSVNSLLDCARKISCCIRTGKWLQSTVIDEERSLCSIKTEREDITVPEFRAIVNYSQPCEEISDYVYCIAVTDYYDIIMEYDLTDVIIYISSHEDNFHDEELRTRLYNIVSKRL